jgi:hypothetical protein
VSQYLLNQPTVQRFLSSFKRRKIILFLLAVLAGTIVYSDVRQSFAKGVRNPNDFVTLYAGAVCTSSECNPYRVADLDSVVRQRRGSAALQDWTDQLPVYPPTTMFLLKPFGALSYANATLTWYWLGLTVYVGGVLWAFLFSPLSAHTPLAPKFIAVLFALHFPKMIQCLGFGNPSLIVTGLLLFAVFHPSSPPRYVLRVGCAALAVWLKVTFALPLMLLVVFSAGTRSKRPWITLGIFLALSVALLFYAAHLPGMHHWFADFRQDVRLGEQNGMSVSARISPSNVLLNTANLPGYFTRNAWIILGFSYIAVGFLSLMLAVALTRLYRSGRSAHRVYEAAIPSVAVLSLMPVYHRFCDIGLLLFVVPWLIRRLTGHTDGLGISVTGILALLYFSWERRIHLEQFHDMALRIVAFVYYRGDALLVLTLAVLLVIAVYRNALTIRGELLAG